MRTAPSACALALTGCVVSAPTPDPNGYLPVSRVSECRTPASDGFTNIVVGAKLSETLLGLLPAEHVRLPLCWYKRSDGLVGLESGPPCELNLVAYFRSVDGDWRLETLGWEQLVLCHERVR